MLGTRTASLLALLVMASQSTAEKGRPRFSWKTLPVFFHSANASGPWSTAAATAIARFAMATNEKNHGMPLPNHTRQSAEISGPAACRQVHNASAGETDTFFYLNSVIDWTTNYKLHDLMVKNPSWRVKNTSGGDIGSLVPGGNWVYDLSIPAMREAWVAECTTAVAAGCI